MTERKPPGTDFTSWIDRQVSDAEKRGAFDNLPGAGKPIPHRPEEADYGQAWLRDYARREGVPEEELLPPPLRLRREIERLTEQVYELGSEREVRDSVAELNRRIVEWRRIPLGPPVFVPLLDEKTLVSRWRGGRSVVQAAPLAASADAEPPPRPRWWRRWRNLRRRGRR